MTQAAILRKRTFDFAVAVFALCRTLARMSEARVPSHQLIRASTSVAANYRATCRARSHREFIAKVGTVIEEADESLFWLEFLQATKLSSDVALQSLQCEADQLVAIFTASAKTARANRAKQVARAAHSKQ
jgi:four helix bundle protein